MVEVASLIIKSGYNIKPVIIENDNYSISAIYSVAEGDTLENRIIECGHAFRYITI